MATKSTIPSKTADEYPRVVKDWAGLSALVEHFSYYSGHDWLFRGGSHATYELRPSIGRADARVKGCSYNEKDELALMAIFKQQARPYLSQLPSSEIEWLAIAQHHGLPTRLLDWTDSLFVAAWFAVEKCKADAAIWVTRNVPSLQEDLHENPFALRGPASFRAPHISPRIGAQGSVFVVSQDPPKPLQLSLLGKVIVLKDAQFTIKKRLSACGINRRNLFPDLAGLSEHLGWRYKHNWLAGYRPRSEPSSKK